MDVEAGGRGASRLVLLLLLLVLVQLGRPTNERYRPRRTLTSFFAVGSFRRCEAV